MKIPHSGLSAVRAVAGLVAAGLTVSWTTVAFAESIESGEPAIGTLMLRTGSVKTSELPSLLVRGAEARGAVRPGFRTVLQLSGPLNEHHRALLRNAGVRLGDYLPQNAYLADVSGADLGKVAALGFVLWLGAWQDEWKIEPEIGAREFASPERRALARAGDVLVQAFLFDGSTEREARTAIDAMQGVRIEESTEIGGMRTLLLRVARDRVPELASADAIRFVEELPEFADRSNSNTRWIVQTNVSNTTPLYAAGIRGEGQVIGIMDSGFQPNHCSFVDAAVPITTANTPGTFPTHRKVVGYNVGLVTSQHGTHVAGTAMGHQASGVNDNTRGIAYEAKVCFRTYGSPVATFPIDVHLTTHHNQGARVHTNSWGDDGTTAYNAICRAIDLFSHNREDSLVCFASTNLTALKNPENSKNVLAVGKSGGAGSQAGSCSTLVGPTSDGRRKPEVFAPGCSTISASSGLPCSTASLTGTSMATPAVAGAAALIRQYFTDGFYPTGAKVAANSLVPSGALLRAMLVNSAVDMTSYPSPNKFPPNTNEGFGRILLDNSVYLAGDARGLLIKDIRNSDADALSTGGLSTTTFRVQSSTQILRVTMAFTDAPATIPTGFAPVNNINLRVISPGGAMYLGNAFDTTTGLSQTGGTADAINSIEHVIISTPGVGVWKVEVAGAGVNVGKQGFGLVITGAVEGVNPCPADLNGDQFVDEADFVLFAAGYQAFECEAPAMPAGCPSDFNGDGVVDDADFVIFAMAYEALTCP